MPGMPTDPNQIMAMLQSLQAAGHNLDEISPDLSVGSSMHAEAFNTYL